MRVTEVGAAFLEDADRLLQNLDHAIATLRESATTGRGRVSLACLSSTVYRLLPPVLAEMKRRHPQIDVVFRDDNMRGILQSLEAGECDVAIVSESASLRGGFAQPLVADSFQVVCRADHPLASRKPVLGRDLAAHGLVLLRRGSAIRDAFGLAFERLATDLGVVHETTQVHTLLGLVEAGLGISVLPSMLCPAPTHAAFAVRPLRQPSISRKLGLVFPAGREPTFAARALADVIRQTFVAKDLLTPPGVSKILSTWPRSGSGCIGLPIATGAISWSACRSARRLADQGPPCQPTCTASRWHGRFSSGAPLPSMAAMWV